MKGINLPGYILLCSIRPQTSKLELGKFCKDYIDHTIKHGSVVRQVFNHGIGETPFPFRPNEAARGEKYNHSQQVSFQIFSDTQLGETLVDKLNKDRRILRYSFLRDDEAVHP
eukprot:snap_masked-scaffold_12-processed-gene-3.45-mRNA-1 protein AED:1.00 eAED:1.00 QI:0/-1/0/0/-1/1/1/0/112